MRTGLDMDRRKQGGDFAPWHFLETSESSTVCISLKQGQYEMQWLPLVAYFFGGAFLANAVPHFVSGMMGRPFQSPFAKPPGQGLSSSTVNVVWGFGNIVAFYGLVCRVGDFSVKDSWDVLAFGAGGLLMALFSAWGFGRFNGGNMAGDR